MQSYISGSGKVGVVVRMPQFFLDPLLAIYSFTGEGVERLQKHGYGSEFFLNDRLRESL